jgi:hypothetical protein
MASALIFEENNLSYQSWQKDQDNGETSNKRVSTENEVSTVGKVTDNVQDQEANFKNHDSAQEIESHLNLRSELTPERKRAFIRPFEVHKD